MNDQSKGLIGGFKLGKSNTGFGLKTHLPIVAQMVYNSGTMTAPIQFSSQEAFEQAVGAFLREKLWFEVSSHSDTVDISHGEYVEVKTYKISVQLDGETITEFSLD